MAILFFYGPKKTEGLISSFLENGFFSEQLENFSNAAIP